MRGHLLLQLGLKAEAADCFAASLERPCSEPEWRFPRRKLAELSLLRNSRKTDSLRLMESASSSKYWSRAGAAFALLTDSELIHAGANKEQDVPINLRRG